MLSLKEKKEYLNNLIFHNLLFTESKENIDIINNSISINDVSKDKYIDKINNLSKDDSEYITTDYDYVKAFESKYFEPEDAIIIKSSINKLDDLFNKICNIYKNIISNLYLSLTSDLNSKINKSIINFRSEWHSLVNKRDVETKVFSRFYDRPSIYDEYLLEFIKLINNIIDNNHGCIKQLENLKLQMGMLNTYQSEYNKLIIETNQKYEYNYNIVYDKEYNINNV